MKHSVVGAALESMTTMQNYMEKEGSVMSLRWVAIHAACMVGIEESTWSPHVWTDGGNREGGMNSRADNAWRARV